MKIVQRRRSTAHFDWAGTVYPEAFNFGIPLTTLIERTTVVHTMYAHDDASASYAEIAQSTNGMCVNVAEEMETVIAIMSRAIL